MGLHLRPSHAIFRQLIIGLPSKKVDADCVSQLSAVAFWFGSTRQRDYVREIVGPLQPERLLRGCDSVRPKTQSVTGCCDVIPQGRVIRAQLQAQRRSLFFVRYSVYGKVPLTQIKYCVLFGAAALRSGRKKLDVPFPP
jgi:hypothetical protein